jgi:hypothetical protein
MLDIMTIEKEKGIDEEGNPVVKTYQLSFELGTLVVSEISNDTITPIMIQPWKCLPDGGRDNFADSADAFDWFDSVKDQII